MTPGDACSRSISVLARVHRERQNVGGIEAGVSGEQIVQGPHEESGADQQHERQRHLRYDQRAAEPATAAADARRLTLQGRRDRGRGALPRRRQAEQYAGDGRHDEREGEHAAIRRRRHGEDPIRIREKTKQHS
jgi:hypothetical protein